MKSDQYGLPITNTAAPMPRVKPPKMSNDIFIKNVEALMYFSITKVFKEVYGVELAYYEGDDLTSLITTLEGDGEFPSCYYNIKEHLDRLKEGYY